MQIVDNIAYGNGQHSAIQVVNVRPMKDHKLWLRFSTGETKVFDFKNMLSQPAFAPLADQKAFEEVYIDYGVPVWQNGDIDIAPLYLYENAVCVAQA